MDNCFESETLFQWLNGSLDESYGIEISTHVSDCPHCQNCLEELTDESSLAPPSNPGTILDGPTFTSEPHFRSLHKKLTEQVLDLGAQSRARRENKLEGDAGNGEIGATLQTAVVDTVAANEGDTLAVIDDAITEQFEETGAIEIDGYRLEGLIGRGGFAQVYRGWEQRLERTVAIKVLDQHRISARNRHRFLREAKVASSIQSENVVRVLTSGETESERPFIVMEFVKGDSLAAWIRTRESNLDSNAIDEGVRLIIQSCNGVSAVHEAGLVHRDIKPSNIFIKSNENIAKVGDFGLARVMNEDTVTLTRATELAGTPAFMSPEQTTTEGKVEFSADIYSLGATLYQVLTGQPPFRGSSMAILKQVTDSEPAPPRRLNESVSKDLETICLKALEKDPRRRYDSAKSLAQDLQLALDGQPIVARPVSRFEKILRWSSANTLLAVSLGMLVVAMALGTAASTTLWLRSEYHAQRSEDSRAQLIASVKTMVSSSLKQKSTYMDMSGDDRTRAVKVVADTYKLMFDTRVGDDLELVRELSVDLAEATEVNLSLAAYARAAELMDTNLHLVGELLSQPKPTDEDRAVAAWFYNQLAEFLMNHESTSNAFAHGQAVWQVDPKAGPDAEAQARVSLLKAKALTTGSTERGSNLNLQNIMAKWRLLLLDNKSTEEQSDETLAELVSLLEEVSDIRSDGPELSAKWMAIHQRMLMALSKKHEGFEAIEFRIERAKVFKNYIAELDSTGQETHWYERDTAVNDFFIGLGLLRLGRASEARPVLDQTVERFQKLVTAFPSNAQFGADLAEAALVVAETDWSAEKQAEAMESYQRTLDAFESCLKSDSGEISIRRRAGRIYELVGQRHMAMSNFREAANCFTRGSNHFLAVFESRYDGPSKEADKAMHEKMLSLAESATAKLP